MRLVQGFLVLCLVGAGTAVAEPPAAEPEPANPPVASPASTPTAEPAPVDPGPARADPPGDTEPEVAAEEPKKKHKKSKKQKWLPKVSGYVQVFFRGRVDTDADGMKDPTAFRVQRVRLDFKGKINKYVGYDVEIDPRAPDITGILRDAYLSFSVIPHHKIRVGQQKTQFGYENNESSTRLYFVNRADVSDNLSRGNVTLRDVGVGLLGSFPIGGGVSIEDAITVVNGNGMNTQADDTPRKNVWGRVGAVYDDPDRLWIRAGVSGGIGDQIQPEDPGPPVVPAYKYTFKRLGFDVEIEHPYALVVAEYVMGWDVSADNPDATGDSTGYYAMIAGKTPWDFGPTVRYDAHDDYNKLTFGGFWGGPSKRLRFLANYEIYQDEVRKHDHRFYLWTQARF